MEEIKDFSLLKGKSILLCMPNYFKIYELFAMNIQALGMDLTLVVPPPFHYKNKAQRIFNFCRKTFLRDKESKNKLIKQFNIEYFLEKTKGIRERSVDYALFIQPDIVSGKQMDALLSIGKKNIAYSWNGLDQYPDNELFVNILKFDTFYVFDPTDYQKYGYLYPNIALSHNFFFEKGDLVEEKREKNNSIFYVGSYFENRIDNLFFIENQLNKFDVPLDIQLVCKEKIPPVFNKNIKFTQEYIDFESYLEKVQGAKILLDFKLSHNGLSFRFFEALKYEKKLITDNASVLEYDFYNPNNIFILHRDNIADLEKFIFSDYQKIPVEIVEKYSFKNWLYDCLK